MAKHKQYIEAPVMDEEPPISSTPETPVESATEFEPLRESVETVRELIEYWRGVLKDTNTPRDQKAETAYRIVKLGNAASHAHISPDEAKIRESSLGVLGFYVPANGEIAITPEGLLDPERFEGILVHEAIHGGKIDGQRISDEGVTQHKTRRLIQQPMHGVYEAEQRQVKNTFGNVGITSVLDAYDFENPQELIDLYLSVEWHDQWKKKWQSELSGNVDIATDAGRKKVMADAMKEWLEDVQANFEEAAPRLFAEAKKQGFDFSKAHEREFTRLSLETEKP